MPPGFGSYPFGTGLFGEWPWADDTVLGALPDVYRQVDDAVAGQRLQQLLQSVTPSLDYIRRKIDDLEVLRDPLRAPTDKSFDESVTLLKVEDIGDGTSRVFISVGSSGDKLEGIRPGYLLKDRAGNSFEIASVVSSGQASDFDEPPVDPATGQETGKHVVVYNLSFDTTQTIPLVSGTQESVSVALSGMPPYNVPVGSQIAENRIRLRWSEGGSDLDGYILNTGKYTFPLSIGTSVNWTTGVIKFSNSSRSAVSSVLVDYTKPFPVGTPTADTEDARINSQHILAFLGKDFGVDVDRHDPEWLQRSYVQHATELWSIKSSADSYAYLGAIAGFYVSAKGLYRINPGYASEISPFNVYEIPIGSGNWYTDVDPKRARFDEIAADILPLDAGPTGVAPIVQSISITSSEFISSEGANARYAVNAISSEMHESFDSLGSLEDLLGNEFQIDKFSVTSSGVSPGTLYFEAIGPAQPSLGAGQISWYGYAEPVAGGSFVVEEIGTQYFGYSGVRYRISIPISLWPYGATIAFPDNWAFVDSYGNKSWIESVSSDGTSLHLEVVSGHPISSGDAYLLYDFPVSAGCDFCRASMIRLEIAAGTIMDTPDALAEDALGRLISRLRQLVPAHVRIAEYVYGPGIAIAEFPAATASSEIIEEVEDDSAYVAYFDTADFPSDQISTDTAAIVASSDVTITSSNVLEEHVDGTNPLSSGWSGTGLWHVTGYRSSTGLYSFNYGQNDSGHLGDVGAIPPDFDTGAQTLGTLRTPEIAAIFAAESVLLRFRHFADMEAGLVKDLASVVVKTSPGWTTIATFDKNALGLGGTGNTGGSFVTVTLDLTGYVVSAGAFTVEFNFDSVDGLNNAGECWYIDDIEVQVIQAD